MALNDYSVSVRWTGNRGQGTAHYRGYDRTWDLCSPQKLVVHCSNEPMLVGDPTLYNPEDMLIGALSSCHMLWFLHLASDAGINVQSYEDSPLARGETLSNGASRFVDCTLRPRISLLKGADLHLAEQLHHKAHDVCFIARSVNFPIHFAAKYKLI